MSRERDIRNWIRTTLEATDLFDNVDLTGDPIAYSEGQITSNTAIVDPIKSSDATLWDGGPLDGIETTCMIRIRVVTNDNDSQVRDERCERLMNQVKVSLDGTNLGSSDVVPAMTYVSDVKWADAEAPMRQIECHLYFRYLTSSSASFDVTE